MSPQVTKDKIHLSWRDLAEVLNQAALETRRDPVISRVFGAAREAALAQRNAKPLYPPPEVST